LASIRKRGERWQVQVRRKNAPPLTKSFLNRPDALTWARQTEVAVDHRQITSAKATKVLFVDLLRRYVKEVTPKKRGADVEALRIERLCQSSLAGQEVNEGLARHLATYRDERLSKVSAGSVRREFVIIRHVLETAIREWDLPLKANPAKMIRLPSPPQGRDRRLVEEELGRLLEGLKKSRNKLLKPAVLLAIETGMRRGELLGVRWGDLNLSEGTLSIPVTKTGYPRIIPLTGKAIEVLMALDRGAATDRVLPITPNALRISWFRLTKRVGVENLHFHDLRHEAISRFFEIGLRVPEVALISGHRDPRMLFRYTHLRATDVRDTIEKLLRKKEPTTAPRSASSQSAPQPLVVCNDIEQPSVQTLNPKAPEP
jgi:integrase